MHLNTHPYAHFMNLLIMVPGIIFMVIFTWYLYR